MHNINTLIRILFYCLWIWIFFYNGLHLSDPMRSFLNCLVLADIITWLGYQFYLLPRMVIQFGIGSLVNIVVMVLLIRDTRSLIPQTIEMQAMAIMVFFSVAAMVSDSGEAKGRMRSPEPEGLKAAVG